MGRRTSSIGPQSVLGQVDSDAFVPNLGKSSFVPPIWELVSPTLTQGKYWIYHANIGLAAAEEKVRVYLAMREWIVPSTANSIET
jgi:hypothetical protein